MALGLGLQGAGYALGFSGRVTAALTLFFIGVLVVFLPAAWRLLGLQAQRSERLWTAVILGFALFVSSALASPLLPSGFDELLHETTLWQLTYFHRLFTTNTLLPISPYYPGLELVTAGLRALTGLPNVACEYLAVGLARIAFVVVLYLVGERLTHSSRAGGLFVIAYVASPQFYSFNSAYSYQTLAIAFGAGAVFGLLDAVDRPDPKMRFGFWLAIACLEALAVTHHLVSFITTVFLVVWALTLGGRRNDPAREVRRRRARIVGYAAVVAVVTNGVWFGISAHQLDPYLGPILRGAVHGVVATITGSGKRRQLFNNSVSTTPVWQRAVIIASIVLFLVAIASALIRLWRSRPVRGGRQVVIPAFMAVLYLVVLVSSLSSDASDAGQRLSTFVFFGVAFLVAILLGPVRNKRALAFLVPAAAVCFLGSLIYGSGPSWSYVPGPYLPVADQRSVDGPAVAAARWASQNLPVDSRIAADRDNGALMAALGHLEPVTALSGAVNVGPLFFDPSIGNYDRSLLAKGHIQYLLVDDRLADGPPAYGYYFEPGETQGKERLTAAQLGKFQYASGFTRVYDNGPIQIYEVGTSGVAPGVAPRRIPVAPESPLSTVLAGLTVLVVLDALRRRRGLAADRVTSGLLIGLVVVGLVGVLVVYTRPPFPLSALTLAGSVVLWITALRTDRATDNERPAGALRIELLALVIGIASLGVGVGLDVGWNQRSFTAPSTLSLVRTSGGSSSAAVSLTGHGRATLEVLTSGRAVWSNPVQPGTSSVPLPAGTTSAQQVALVQSGHPRLEVSG